MGGSLARESSGYEATPGRRDTDRTEAFSDGIFAFAITLLVLNLRDPVLEGTVTPGQLLDGLVGQWPALFAFVTSFATILIMWVNHHNMFNHIQRVDTRFMFLNGILFFFIVLTPFTTLIVSDHAVLNDRDATTAAAVYAADFLLLAIVWNGLWRYCSKENRLLAKEELGEHVSMITRTYNAGLVFGLILLAQNIVAAYSFGQCPLTLENSSSPVHS